MELCDICGMEAELLDGIYYGKIVRTCHKCVRVNNIVLISKPSAAQLSGVKEYKVKDRLMQLANLYDKHREKHVIEAEVKRRMAEKTTSVEIIKKAREKAGITQEQVAREIGEDIEVIVNIENGKEIEERVRKKLEQYLGIKLEKEAGKEGMEGETELSEEESGLNEKEEGEQKEAEEASEEGGAEEKKEKIFHDNGTIDFKSKGVTIGDLKRLQGQEE